VGQTVVAGEAREGRQGLLADCSTIDGNAALGFREPSASVASRSSGWTLCDWSREGTVAVAMAGERQGNEPMLWRRIDLQKYEQRGKYGG
jgi:hypothetical protein